MLLSGPHSGNDLSWHSVWESGVAFSAPSTECHMFLFGSYTKVKLLREGIQNAVMQQTKNILIFPCSNGTMKSSFGG